MADSSTLGGNRGRIRAEQLLRSRQDFSLHPPDGHRRASITDLYFYRPGHLLVHNDHVDDVTRELDRHRVELRDAKAHRGFTHFTTSARSDPHDLIKRIQQTGGRHLRVTPNHLLFGVGGWMTEPATEPEPADPPEPEKSRVGTGVSMAIIDTGLAKDYRKLKLLNTGVKAGPGGCEDPYERGEGLLAHQAGHGTFVAGVVRQRAPAVRIEEIRVLDSHGIVDEASLSDAIASLLPASSSRRAAPQIINLSLGGYTRADAPLMALDWLADIEHPLILAAAGNSDSTRPFYPAALKHLDIAAVGAVEEVPPVDGDLPHSNEIVRVPGQQDRYARAWFSNHGDWVTCSAPGVDIVSTYQWGYYRPLDGGPLRSFNGGARWSGTSFAAPRVAGALAARMQADRLDNPHEAFARLIAQAPAGPPGLGKLIL